MSQQPFLELTADLERELRSSVTIAECGQRSLCPWMMNTVSSSTEDLGLRFLEIRYNFLELEKDGGLTQSLVNIGRVVRMLGDFQQHRSILRRYYKQRELLQSGILINTLASYAADCQQREYSRVTRNQVCQR